MACLSFTHFFPLPRLHNDWCLYPFVKVVQVRDVKLHGKWGHAALSRKRVVEASAFAELSEEEAVVKKRTYRTSKDATSRTRKKVEVDALVETHELGLSSDDETAASTSAKASKKSPRRTRKKAVVDALDKNANLGLSSDNDMAVSALVEDIKKKPQRTQKKASSSSETMEEEKTKKVKRGRKTKRKANDVEAKTREAELSDNKDSDFLATVSDESKEDLELEKDGGDDISYTYGWPPLVCCFGHAHHAFVPSGRPANRLIDYEIHERMSDALWAPEKFVRAPGGSAGSVAIALAILGGKVALMGKLGDDDYGHAMLYYLNVNNVQTRAICLDSKRLSAMSLMKIGKRGRLRTTCTKPSAEDSLLKSEINIDVLKEAKMFYINTHSLLERNMRSTALQAIKISKKFGSLIFYDVNLPLPLWHSDEETKLFIKQVWELADIIEVTKQELEFLCGITPTEEFNTKNNLNSKFVHYKPSIIAPLWHENLKTLFVTNGTSKIHYYTKDHNGSVNGMEDPPLTPFTCDMSAAGDGIVAALMRMLTVQPHLIADEEYLVHSIKYAINCGVIDQWLLGQTRGYPPKEDAQGTVMPDEDGIRSITEKEYRTRVEPAMI